MKSISNHLLAHGLRTIHRGNRTGFLLWQWLIWRRWLRNCFKPVKMVLGALRRALFRSIPSNKTNKNGWKNCFKDGNMSAVLTAISSNMCLCHPDMISTCFKILHVLDLFMWLGKMRVPCIVIVVQHKFKCTNQLFLRPAWFHGACNTHT